jgi:hypothetical protein
LNIAAYCGDTGLITVGTEKRREKVVVLRELQRVIIYTRELSKQAIEGHVSTAFIGYSVNEGARLTQRLTVTET